MNGGETYRGHLKFTVMNLKEVSVVVCFLQTGSAAQMQARSKSMRFKQRSSGFVKEGIQSNTKATEKHVGQKK